MWGTFFYGYPSDVLTVVAGWAGTNGLFSSFAFSSQLIFSYFVRLDAALLDLSHSGNTLFPAALLILVISFFFFSKRLLSSYFSFVTLIIFATSLYISWHGMQNLEIVLGAAFLPLFVLALLKLEEPLNGVWGWGTTKPALLAGLAFALVALTSFQIGYLAMVFALGFFIFRRFYGWWFEKRGLMPKETIVKYLFFAIFSSILALPGTFPLIQYKLGQAPAAITENMKTALTRNTVLDLVAYGARPWDYLLPSIYHPVFGSYIRNFYQYTRDNFSYQYWSTFLPERPNYLTFTALLLAGYAIFRAIKKRGPPRSGYDLTELSDEDRKNVLTLAFLAIVMFLVSMPALVSVKGFNIYFPSFFLFKLFPMFRVYARAGVFVLLCVAVLAGYGLKLWLQKIREDWLIVKLGRISLPARKSVVLTSIVCGLIIFENLNFPPFPVMDIGRVPQVYAWLKNQPGDLVIAEYPRDNSVVDIGGGCPNWLDPKITRDYNWAYTVFYQMVHGKENLNMEKLSKEERVALGDLGLAGSYQVLKKYGVNYVLVHTKDPMIGTHPFPYPQENPLDECWQRRIMPKPEKIYEKFTKAAEFDDGVIYGLR